MPSIGPGCGSGPSSPPSSSTEAILDADGTLVATDAECKQGVDIAYDGTWGYHPLLGLAGQHRRTALPGQSQRQPPLARAGRHATWTRPSTFAVEAGFRRILLRGDTDFTQTKHLDRWDEAGDVRFIFGYRRDDPLKAMADDLPAEAYSFLERPPRYEIKTAPRQQPERVKPEIVKRARVQDDPPARRDGRRVRLSPGRLPPGLSRDRRSASGWGSTRDRLRLFEEYRYFFYITNDRETTAEEIVFSANDRCDQENLIAQLKSGVHALTTPVDDLVSNWAYMVMASLAWSLKAWSALLVPVRRGTRPSTSREAVAVADGVPDVLRGDDPDAVPDRADGTAVDLPVAVLEPVARRVPAVGGAVARLLAVLSGRTTEVGVRMPRSLRAFRIKRGGETMKQAS